MRLIELLVDATDGSVCEAPGFIFASLHRSPDGMRVTMYAQWQSIAAYEAMRGDERSDAILREAMELSTFDPQRCEVVRTFQGKM